MTTACPSETAVNVFVTGQPGIGKTSLVVGVARKLPQDLIAGFYTVDAHAEGTRERLGLDVVTFAGERAPLCRLRRGCGPKVGKYYVAIQDFERVVLPHLMPTPRVKLHVIDEVGRMALCSQKFADAVTTLLASPKAAVFGSLPAPRYGHPLPLVDEIKQRPDTAVLTLTKANRDATAVHLEELLARLLADEGGGGSSSGSHGSGGAFHSGGVPQHTSSTESEELTADLLGVLEGGATGGMGADFEDLFFCGPTTGNPTMDSPFSPGFSANNGQLFQG